MAEGERTMSEPIWNQFLTERDKQVFAQAGYGARAGFGKRPALLVIDVSWAFTGEKPEPLLEAIKSWPSSSGEDAWKAVDHIKPLIAKAREKGLPVIYTTNVKRADAWDRGGWEWKKDRPKPKKASNRDGYEIIDDVKPGPKDIVVIKQKPSGFFGTPLASYLTLLGADSVVVTGGTTSGCVRATCVDAFSNNYRVALVEDGVFDRSQASHAMTLCDLNAKYADVVKTEEVLTYFDTLPEGLFNLPTGNPL
jgi:maleamate amidohydrolase